MIDIIELVKKADIHDELRLSERNLSSAEIEYMGRFAALYKQGDLYRLLPIDL